MQRKSYHHFDGEIFEYYVVCLLFCFIILMIKLIECMFAELLKKKNGEFI